MHTASEDPRFNKFALYLGGEIVTTPYKVDDAENDRWKVQRFLAEL